MASNASLHTVAVYRPLLEALPNAVIGVDQQGHIVYANGLVQATFGYRPEELYGQPIEMLLPERLRNHHVAERNNYLQHASARPMGIGLELAGRHKDGREFPVEISLAPLQNGEPLVFALVVDISLRKVAEAQLLQSQKLESVGRLAGGIAHDFNNILFAIGGYAEMLGQDLAGVDSLTEAASQVEAIRAAAERATSLASQLLTFGRRQLMASRLVDVGKQIHELEPLLRQLVGVNVELHIEPTTESLIIAIDPSQLDQILVNLALNARDAMSGSGKLSITVSPVSFDAQDAGNHMLPGPGDYVRLAVSDTGAGMDAETRNHIFEPFFTTKGGAGHGLGLSTTYGIVRQAGGYIWLYSEPGQGTIFRLYFPSHQKQSESVAAEVEPAMVQSTGRLLVVEDDNAVRQMMSRLLSQAGYEVTVCADANMALEIIEREGPPDVLISDVVMPGINGIELVERVHAQYPNIGKVLLSGYMADTLKLDQALALGVIFVSKPVARSELLAAIERTRS